MHRLAHGVCLSTALALTACGRIDGNAGVADLVTSDTHLGGCILLEPLGEAPDDVYGTTGVVRTTDYPPFTKTLTSHGLMLVARDDASDEFMIQVGRVIGEIFPRDSILDLDTQLELLRNHYRYRAVIPVPVGDDLDFFEADDPAWHATFRANSICDIIMEDVPRGQVMEVVEHILHYVSDIGLHYTFPEDWGLAESSALAAAMDEAIAKGYYNVEQYRDEGENRDRVLLQEFAYWVISTAWNLQRPYGPNEQEWTIRDETELREKLPELYAMYERTVAQVMVAPTPETLRQIGPTRAQEDR